MEDCALWFWIIQAHFILGVSFNRNFIIICVDSSIPTKDVVLSSKHKTLPKAMDKEWTLMLQNHQKIKIPAMKQTTVSCNKSDTHGKVMFKRIS